MANAVLPFVQHRAAVCAIWQPFIKLTWTPPCLNPCPVFQLCPVCMCLSLRKKKNLQGEGMIPKKCYYVYWLGLLHIFPTWLPNRLPHIGYQSLGKWWDVISTDQKLRLCQSRQRNSCGKYIKCIFCSFYCSKNSIYSIFFLSQRIS